MAQKYDAACPHCGTIKEVKLNGIFNTQAKGKKAVTCKEGCGLPFVVAWQEGEGIESRKER